MSYGRFRRDPCGALPAPPRWCERCSRLFGSPEHERAMVHACPVCAERQRAAAVPADKERVS